MARVDGGEERIGLGGECVRAGTLRHEENGQGDEGAPARRSPHQLEKAAAAACAGSDPSGTEPYTPR